MPTNNANVLVQKIKTLLNKQSGGVSLFQILSSHEKVYLEKKLQGMCESGISSEKAEDISVKFETLIALLLLLLRNPSVKEEIEKSNESKQTLDEFEKIVYEMAKVCFQNESNFNSDKLELLSKLGMLSLISDRFPEFDVIARESLPNFDGIESLTETPEGSSLKNYFLFSSIFLMKRISKSSEVDELRRILSKTQQSINNFQKNFIENKHELEEGYVAGGYANLLHVIHVVGNYMIEGKVEKTESSDIYTVIDSYCYNAIKLFEYTTNNEEKSLANLFRYALTQLCQNSIWNISSKSPILKKFVENVLTSNEKNFILTLMPSQRDSILNLLTTKKSVVLTMPTSSGKSLLAELYILFTLHNFRDEKPTVVYIVPTNALINQVSRELKNLFSSLGYKIETVLPFYQVDEIEEEFLTQEHIDVLVTTPEKLDFLVRKDHVAIRNLKLVVMDEAHNLGDKERGSKFELVLSTIKQKNKDINFLLLSPFISNADKISTWLGGSPQDSLSIAIDWAPAKQYIGCNLLKNNQRISTVLYLPSDRNNIIREPVEVAVNRDFLSLKQKFGKTAKSIALVEKYIHIGTILVLCGGAKTAQDTAEDIVEHLSSKNLVSDLSADIRVQEAIRLIENESSPTDPLINCIKYGIAFHHSRMPSSVKDEIENLIREKKIKIVCATTTLAQGVNFPITTVIFNTLHVGGWGGTRKLEGAEFWNIAGRAGRAFLDNEGHIITPSANSQKATKENTEEYIRFSIGEVVSSLKEILAELGDNFIFDYSLIKNKPKLSNFLQYLSHILNVSYNYNLDQVDSGKIRNILSNSLYYSQLTFTEGFLESQQKVTDFASGYLEHLKLKRKGDLKLADLFGVSDLSLSRFMGEFSRYKDEILQEEGRDSLEDYLSASKIILSSKDSQKLARIVDMISKLPEIKLALTQSGSFNPESIAKIIIGWVNGKKISDITSDVRYPEQNYNDILGNCNKYVNSNLKSYVPWGISIFQQFAGDLNTDDGQNLPSYIYYGVNNKEAVILSKLGVPRFAVEHVKTTLREMNQEIQITTKNLDQLAEGVRRIPSDKYSAYGENTDVTKKLIDKGLII